MLGGGAVRTVTTGFIFSKIFYFNLDNSKSKVFVDCLGAEVEKKIQVSFTEN